MFISKSRIKKLLRNPVGGAAFVMQYIKSKLLKNIKIDNVEIGEGNYDFITSNNSFWKYITNIDLADNEFEIFDHKIDLDSINWNYDYLNNAEIKNQYYFDLREWIIKNSFKGFDIKNVWELSRGYYLVDRAILFAQTKDTKHVEEYIKLINSWIDQNPYLYSSNWTNPMEVSIRAINWILSYQIITKENPDCLDSAFKQKYYMNLYQSFNFLINNIETYPYKTNHYIIDNLGIFILALSLKNINSKWIRKSLKNLEESIEQFNSEGVDFENSSNYHLLKMEALSLGFILYNQNITKLEKIYTLKDSTLEKLEKVYDFASYLFKNEKDTFNYGDNDETEVWKIGNLKDKIDLYYWVLFKKELDAKGSKIFGLSGYGFLKSKNISSMFLRMNQKNSSHFHNDLLSFQLNFKSEDFFIDPNTFNYNLSKEKRVYYLATQRHNTCYVNCEEHGKIESSDSFLRNKQRKVALKKYITSDSRDEMSLEIQYKNATHLRSLVLNKEKGKLTIFDTFSGAINTVEWNFYLPKEVEVINDLKLRNVLILSSANSRLVMEIPETVDIKIQNAYVSEKYNSECLGKNIKLIFKNSQKIKFLSFQIDIKENYLN